MLWKCWLCLTKCQQIERKVLLLILQKQIQAHKNKLALITHASFHIKVHIQQTGQNHLINKSYNPKSQDLVMYQEPMGGGFI